MVNLWIKMTFYFNDSVINNLLYKSMYIKLQINTTNILS